MPNWIVNEVTMEGIASLPLYEVDEEGKKDFDFNKIILMPKSLDVPSTTSVKNAIIFYWTDELKTHISKIDSDGIYWLKKFGLFDLSLYAETKKKVEKNPSLKDEFREYGSKYYMNLKHFGYATWYDWCRNVWGTKWNACNTKVIDDNIISFDTAWTPPLPIFEQLSILYPDKEVDVTWYDDIDRAKENIKFLNGKCS